MTENENKNENLEIEETTASEVVEDTSVEVVEEAPAAEVESEAQVVEEAPAAEVEREETLASETIQQPKPVVPIQQPKPVVPTYVPPVKKERQPKKKVARGGIKRGTLAFLLVITMLLSGALGFGGAILALKYYAPESETTPIENVPTITPEQLAAADSDSFNAAAVAAIGMDSVVEITTEVTMRGNMIMGQYVTQGAGSGVIISEDGYIVTNNHVIEGASKITVRTRAGDEYSASIVGHDEKTDLAVIKIETDGLKAAKYGSSGNLVVGQPVLAIGNPLGELGGTVTEGIISALDREVLVEGQRMTLLQTDASVNPGNSGGGLFDGQGTLVGIVNAKSSGSGVEGLGFAIPIDEAKLIIDELIEHGYVTGRAEAGIEVTYVDEQTAYLYRMGDGGVYISAVNRGSPAEKAGLESGDRIISIAGEKVSLPQEAVDIIQSHKAGEKVVFKIARGGIEFDVTVTLGEQKPSIASLMN